MSRLVVLTEIIAPYRIPVFNALAHQSGVDLRVLFLAETDPTLRQWEVYRDEIAFPYKVLSSLRKRVGSRHMLLNWGVGPALKDAKPDAIVCGGYNYAASWNALLWARRNHVPFYLWIESTLNDQRRGRLTTESLKRKFMKSCDGFVVPGESSREYVKALAQPNATMYCAPNAVDNQRFACLAAKARKARDNIRLGLPARYLLFVGRLIREKGVFDLLQAYSSLAPCLRSEVALVFVGEGAARVELEKRSAAIRPGAVCFRGFQQRDDLPAYYAFADAFVFPTHSDTWGLVVNEAMACGLPIIASEAAGCVADLVSHHENGFVFPSGGVALCAQQMADLLRDDALRSKMAENSLKKITAYTPDACASGIAQVVKGRSRNE